MYLQAVQAIGQANQREAQIRIEKANAKVQAAQTKMQGNLYGMNLQKNFNKSMASDVVMAASQHRRGGSVEAMARAAEKQFNWDMDFAELSTEIQMMGANANIASLDSAQKSAFGQGILNAGISAFTTYEKSLERTSIDAPKSLLAKKEA